MKNKKAMSQSRSTFDWLGNVVALLVTVAVNTLANILPLGGLSTGEISALYPSLFTPAGYTFAIWSLIYLAMTAFVMYQALPSQREDALLKRISIWFKLSCAANCAWIVLWHNQLIPHTLFIMLILLGSLIIIYRRINSSLGPMGQRERWLLYAPFSVYLGWITVATIANVSAVQTALGLSEFGLSAVSWTVLKLAFAGLIVTIVSRRYSDGIYTLVFSWAAIGIASAQVESTSVLAASFALAIFCTVLAIKAFRA